MPISRARTLEILVSTSERLLARCLIGCGQYRLGHERANQITVDEASISGKHAMLYLTEEGEIYLEDLQSSNGTYVEGELLREPQRITVASQVQLGACQVRLRVKPAYRGSPPALSRPIAPTRSWDRKARRS